MTMQDPEVRLARLEAGLDELARLTRALPDGDTAIRAMRIESQVRRLLLLMLIPILLTASGLVWAGFTFQHVSNVVADNRRGAHCILQELTEHRNNAKKFDEAIAAELGMPFPTIATPPHTPFSAEEIARTCAPFYGEGTQREGRLREGGGE